MSAAPDRAPVAAEEHERSALDRLDQLLEEGEIHRPKLVGPRGEEIDLPVSVLRLLHHLVHLLARGQVITLVPVDRQLTTQQAADILNVSRPYLVQLLDRGAIPYTKTGSHRRIRFDDLMSYKRGRDTQRRAGLRELTRLSQEMGLYD